MASNSRRRNYIIGILSLRTCGIPIILFSNPEGKGRSVLLVDFDCPSTLIISGDGVAPGAEMNKAHNLDVLEELTCVG